MNAQYFCREENRRRVVRDTAGLNGIDYLEIGSADQKTLKVFFLKNLPGQSGGVPATPALKKMNFLLQGGVRISGIEVVSATFSQNVATLKTNVRGDFSTYTLSLVTSATDLNSPPPAHFDPALAAIDFSFKAECPSDFDCAQKEICPPRQFSEPPLSYLAKDYNTFRQLMLDRVSALVPGWTDRNEADLGVTVVELFAYVADGLSYRQDAVATEAYLGTARSRISLRRHARLLDYRLHEGCNARVFVHLNVTPAADGKILPTGSLLLTRGNPAGPLVTPAGLDRAVQESPTVFATMHAVTLVSARDEINFHTWSDARCCLPRGATRATLRDDPPTALAVGDLILFEEIVGAISGLPADADPSHRAVVRLIKADPVVDPVDGAKLLEIAWAMADALPFPLCLSVDLPGAVAPTAVGVARGNIVLADHGYPGPAENFVFDDMPPDRAPRGQLARANVTFAIPFDPAAALKMPAASLLNLDPAAGIAAARLYLDGDTWIPQADLLESERFAREFVVEVERDGVTQLRFGDDVLGERPPDNAQFVAVYRTGNGLGGNIGAESLVRVVADLPAQSVVRVRNPLPATGGTDPESLEQVRQFAPEAFRTQERAVTAADWIEVAERFPEVQRAAAAYRWTGSWYTAFVYVDRQGAQPVTGDPVFLAALTNFLEKFRLAGYDLEIQGPVFVPLDLGLTVCVAPGYFASDVEASLRDALSARILADGDRGFFHPDNFTFGQSVYLSQIIAAAMGVVGVSSVTVTVFHRFGKKSSGELAAAVLRTGDLEIVRCDNDPNFPENGRLVLNMKGGL